MGRALLRAVSFLSFDREENMRFPRVAIFTNNRSKIHAVLPRILAQFLGHRIGPEEDLIGNLACVVATVLLHPRATPRVVVVR